MMRVFISYSHRDEAFLKGLWDHLRQSELEILNASDDWKCEDTVLNASRLELIRRSDLLLALIGDYEPNVYFELGFAMADGKQVLIVFPHNKELPLSLNSIRSIKADSFDTKLINRIVSTLDVLAASGNRTVENRENEKHVDINVAYKAYLHDPDYFDRMDYKAFEESLYQWLKADGYDIERVKDAKDGGCDLLIWNYKEYPKTLIELKKLNKNGRVSINQVQQFLGTIETGHADRGIFVTTSGFTDAAKAFVHSTHDKIELWNLEKLFKVLRK